MIIFIDSLNDFVFITVFKIINNKPACFLEIIKIYKRALGTLPPSTPSGSRKFIFKIFNNRI